MLQSWMKSLQEFNIVSIFLLLIMLVSLLQGWGRGASRSAGRLLSLLREGVFILVALVLSVPFTQWMSPKVQEWLTHYSSTLPNRDLSQWEQIYYTFIRSMAESPLLRFAVLFILSYSIIRLLLRWLTVLIFGGRGALFVPGSRQSSSIFSRFFGALIGLLIGAGRCIVVVALLFVFVSLYPNSSFTQYVEASPIYQEGAKRVIEPLTGHLVKDKLPVFTKAVEKELSGIMQRKYEVIDHAIPDDIEAAAAEIVKGATTDEEKARRLYDWVGTRVQYDYGKVDDYEQKGIWHEQSPQNTFDTRKGVCIDYARLYAVMARSQGLQVRVVTGQGYNGQGGYGPHAWNEVYLSEQNKWVPLDPTWAQSGDWFNPPNFAATHIKDEVLSQT
ncbi:transglutaminase-like domain-containing protein [Paenibacillus sp. KQZ6P-2]|uniref:Transglutaminase-like domain-containing protein n=1 Tax=Paenibacillus mangrovi TaxID=2931978 RepID=A0A9X2B488_9BACL|nr:transglutaminase-like domain-containing protein [Paenibacillus mangrovi]MCJ8014369.1 transglutaminase-like domain-containing protein [Paenibacillus mangrovi]